MTRSRIKVLTCACCGTGARGRQWHNRDMGYGLCPKCYAQFVERGELTEKQIEEDYGKRGEHFCIPPSIGDEAKVFTAFCQESDGTGTVWIGVIGPFHETDPLEYLMFVAREKCNEDWDFLDPHNDIHVLGLAVGDVKIHHWQDLAAV